MTLFLTCYRNSCPSLPTQAGFQEWKPSPPDSLTKYYREEQQEEADLGWKINKRGKMERREEFFRRFPPRDVWSWRFELVERRMKVSRFPSRATRVSKYLGRCGRSKWKTRRSGQYARRFLTNGQVNVRQPGELSIGTSESGDQFREEWRRNEVHGVARLI